jgi:dihydroorotate dehydrogenase (NAD+) catalytic subunit
MTGLGVEIVGIRLANPTMLASGILDETGRTMLEASRAGAGAVVTKSVGLEPRNGHANPSVVELPFGLLNAMGLPNPGLDYFSKEISIARSEGTPVIGSVLGSTPSEIAEVALGMVAAGVDAVELNLSCPHATGLGAELGSTTELVEAVCGAVKDVVKVPVFAKLTPNTSSISLLALAAERGGADAVVAINTVKGMVISPEARRPVLANRYGGLSGAAIRPIGVRCVYEIYDAVDIPIIGVGGISTHRDALEYLMAGASAVQMGTAIRSAGLAVFTEVCRGISGFMDENGFRSVSELVGVAHDG